ncbi:O-linked N-acetylglucosamine transferase [Gloeobacter kilaueensis]|uniref:O-linked N-acetylglucosamine transferase n=1 Tax=Gloeobacter kilaueensis (strain ATCC BAA-2537 / CCAP 1431/1 / ULC 316 / JS1) TaxID=1183438 RepID=U5QM49_GLOK1|nr:O-linked N-acetylglucosamine transferase [Gloeobacter kilaueensis]AGY59948.1 O-linked N-acetylglucosamine transferase [Gloeobacter kilaueensis JS1]
MQSLEADELLRIPRLYFQREYDQLSELLLGLLAHFEQNTYVEMSPELAHGVDLFVAHFLYVFSQDDYVLSEPFIPRFLRLNPVISNLVALSSFETTDPFLEILRHRPRNFARILILYSARNRSRFESALFFQAEPALASLWYGAYLETYRSALVNPEAQVNLKAHLRSMGERLNTLHNFSDIFFGATYIDGEADRAIKQWINLSIQTGFAATGVRCENTPNPRKLAVATGFWFARHSVYRTLSKFVEALEGEYELTLLHLGDWRNDLELKPFAAVHHIQIEGGQLDLSSIARNDFSVLYFPDIGMNAESILLSNLRIAPVQICGTGHPLSTCGAQIDYFISGAAVEAQLAERHYTERLVLLPGLGAVHNLPRYSLKHPPRIDSRIVINCPWYAQKVNHAHLKLLLEIVGSTAKTVRFRFFSGGALLKKNDYLPFARDLKRILGAEQVEVVPALPYDEYMEQMEQGDFCLDSYHFGGSNVVADCLHLQKPIVTLEGDHWYNRIGSQMLREVSLAELVARHPEQYVRLAVRLIEDADYRLHLQTVLARQNAKGILFDSDDGHSFKAAIDYLSRHHQALQQQQARTPIFIQPATRESPADNAPA